MHEMFGAVRVWQLEHVQGLPRHAAVTADRILGAGRWKKCEKKTVSEPGTPMHLQELALEVLHSGGWVDNPDDSVRCMGNMELATIQYVEERYPHMENWPIYVENDRRADCMVGIEQHFDVVLQFEDGHEVRYIGTVDGLVQKATTHEWTLDENKTASRLDRGWQMSFEVNHQLSGYSAASTTIFGFEVFKCRCTGVKIKPTFKGEDVIPIEPEYRTPEMIIKWADWVREMAAWWDRWKDDYENALRFTHSCNRYFRPCSLIPFCCDTAEGRKIAFEEEMVEASKSPSERAVVEL